MLCSVLGNVWGNVLGSVLCRVWGRVQWGGACDNLHEAGYIVLSSVL